MELLTSSGGPVPCAVLSLSSSGVAAIDLMESGRQTVGAGGGGLGGGLGGGGGGGGGGIGERLDRSNRRRGLDEGGEDALPALDHGAQLRRWRTKASLFAQLAVRAELDADRDSLPSWLPPEDFFACSLQYYGRAFRFCKAFGITGRQFEVLCAELGFLCRVTGRLVPALEMAALSNHEELLLWAMGELTAGSIPIGEQETVAKILFQARFPPSCETQVTGLLEKLASFSNTCALFFARHLARLAAVESDEQVKSALLSQLASYGHLPEVPELIARVGDVVLEVYSVEEPELGLVTTIRASRLTLCTESAYFSGMLSGQFSEGRQQVVRLETRFPTILPRAIVFLYSGRVDIDNATDAIEMLACATELGLAELRDYAKDYLVHGIKSLELDGDSVASVLLIADNSPSLKDKLLSKFKQGLSMLVSNVSECLPTDVDEFCGTADWQMLLEKHRDGPWACELLDTAATVEVASVIIDRFAFLLDGRALVSLSQRFPNCDAIANVAEPDTFNALVNLNVQAKLKLLRRLADMDESAAGGACVDNWFISIEKEEYPDLVAAAMDNPSLCAASISGMGQAMIKFEADALRLSLLLKLVPMVSVDILGVLLFAAVTHDRPACVELLIELDPTVLNICQPIGRMTFSGVHEGKPPVKKLPTPPPMPKAWKRASTRPLAIGKCKECHIVQGHMTTCSHFWKNTRSNADKLFGINNNNNNDNSNTNNDNTPLQGALSVRDAFRRILSSDVFPHLHSNRSVLVHAALSGASEDTMHFLMEKGAPVVHESEPQTFSVLECCVWRGYSEKLVERLLPPGEELIPANLSLGWAALHVALYMNQRHLLRQLWFRSNRRPYKAKIYAGNTIDVSIDQILQAFDITDETIAVVIELTHEDLALFPESGNNAAVASNSNNSYAVMVEESVLAVPPKLESRVDVVEGVVYSGTLTKQVKASIFRRYRQDRFCALLRGEAQGEFRWRENNPSMTAVFEKPVLNMQLERNMLIVNFLGNMSFRYVLSGKLETDAWTKAAAVVAGGV